MTTNETTRRGFFGLAAGAAITTAAGLPAATAKAVPNPERDLDFASIRERHRRSKTPAAVALCLLVRNLEALKAQANDWLETHSDNYRAEGHADAKYLIRDVDCFEWSLENVFACLDGQTVPLTDAEVEELAVKFGLKC